MPIFLLQQAGTGPSRRHIQGSKIAKGHQSFKVFSSTALKIFLKKVSQRRKKLKGRTLWDFSIPSLSQNSKKNEGETLWEKIILVSSGGLKRKTLTKSHDYSRLFSLEKRRLKMERVSQLLFLFSVPTNLFV